jgi:Glycosyl hydrolase family 63 C-terminal domain
LLWNWPARTKPKSLALKFFEHYIYIGAAMKNMGGRKYSLWDEDDGFFYDVLRYPDGSFNKFRVRSLVGIIPLYAAETLRLDDIENFQEFKTNFLWFVKNRKQLTESCCHYIERKRQYELTIVDEDQLRRMLERLLGPEEFLSDFGIRSLSKYHGQRPFIFGQSEVRYDPAESDNKIKGGNSNWRGPIWFPTTFLIIESLRILGTGYSNDFKLGIPGDSNCDRNLLEIAGEIANRMIGIFARNEQGRRRPVYGGATKFQGRPALEGFDSVLRVLSR